MRIRLRQIVIVAADLAAAEARIQNELAVELCYRDPGVAHFGLKNALFPIGDQLLEVVSPVEEGTTAGRFLDKRGGDGGYMVIFEIDDLSEMRANIAAAGARIVYEAKTDGIIGIHLHPADVGGAILSVDQTESWGEWPWAGPDWRDHRRTERVVGVEAVVIAANDPQAMAARWSAVLGVRATVDGDGVTVATDDGRIDFVPAGERGEGVDGFVLRAAPGAAPIDTEICNVSIRTI